MGEKIAEDWIEKQIRMMLTQDASVTHTIASEAAKTGAVVTGQATQVAAVAGASTAKSAVEATADSQSILNSAYTAAAKAYTSLMQSVPAPFNLIVAPAGAAAVFAAVAAYDVISAEGGLARVAYDGQIAELHRNETVLPARIAVPLTNLAESGGFDRITNNSGGDIHISPHFTINAVDGASVSRVINSPEFGREFKKMAASAISQGKWNGMHPRVKSLAIGR